MTKQVVQFNENHKWCGCFGTVEEIKEITERKYRIMVGVPIPAQEVAYIFCDRNDYDLIGATDLVLKEE